MEIKLPYSNINTLEPKFVKENFTVIEKALQSSSKQVDAPATAGASGFPGDIAIASGFLYVCVAPNTWKRATLNTF